KDFPQRLLAADDAPSLLFYKGSISLNPGRTVAIIGTRNNTDYGKQAVKSIIEQLKLHNITILSGLAAGIDGIAHKQALEHKLDTIGILGHGLDMMYPAQHKLLARKMIQQGGLLTEFPSGTT